MPKLTCVHPKYTFVTSVDKEARELKYDPKKCLKLPKDKDIWATKIVSIGAKVFVQMCQFTDPATGVVWTSGWFYKDHWKGWEDFIQPVRDKVSQYSAKGSSVLRWKVDIRVQNDNVTTWHGTGARQCFLSSVVPLIQAHKGDEWLESFRKKAGTAEPEGAYSKHLNNFGDTTSAYAHVRALSALGLPVAFRPDADTKDLIEALHNGPCAIGTRHNQSGHWVTVYGYDEANGNVLIGDPNGLKCLKKARYGVDTYKDIAYSEENNPGHATWYTPEDMKSVWTDRGPNTGYLMFFESPSKMAKDADKSIHEQTTLILQNTAHQTTLPSYDTKTNKPIDGQSWIKIKKMTYAKASEAFSGTLSQDEKTLVKAGQEFHGTIRRFGDHIIMSDSRDDDVAGLKEAYFFRDHIEIITPGLGAADMPGVQLTEKDYIAAAKKIGCEVATIKAVVEVEASGAGFLKVDGVWKPKILFESHHFYYHTKGKYPTGPHQISSRYWNRSSYYGGAKEYTRLEAAIEYDRTAAYKSASWGLFQVLGDNALSMGYPSVEEFVRLHHLSEAEHLEGFLRFVEVNNLTRFLKQRNFLRFALGYNGEAAESHGYPQKLEAAYKRHK